jgi:hypothetical protein
MSRNTKIILGIIIGLVVLCGIACAVAVLGFGLLGRSIASGVKTNPAQASQTAASIADFTPPADFQPTNSVTILGVKLVTYQTQDNNSALFLMQLPTQGEITSSQIEQLQRTMEQQSGRSLSNVRTIDSRTTTIRGQPAQVILQEGTDSNNNTYRQLLVAFQGKGGTALLAAIGPASTWNQSAYDQMIQTIH